MNADDYQKLAARTLLEDVANFDSLEMGLLWNVMGLAGEVGEVVEAVKKGIFHRHGLDHEKMVKELGDCLWYLSAICTKLDVTLSQVMEANISKLEQRYPNGFTSADSIKRADVRNDDAAS